MAALMSRDYTNKIEVRGYELDGYGHVNHACYFHYMEFARYKLLQQEGVDLRAFSQEKLFPVVHECWGKFIKPAYLGDLLEIRTQVTQNGPASLIFDQEIYRENQLVFTGNVEVVLLNDKGRPTKLPEKLLKLV